MAVALYRVNKLFTMVSEPGLIYKNNHEVLSSRNETPQVQNQHVQQKPEANNNIPGQMLLFVKDATNVRKLQKDNH